MNIELNEKVANLIKKQILEGRQIGVQVSAYQYGEKNRRHMGRDNGTQ